MPPPIVGKKLAVTGAASGIGKAFVQRLINDGNTVIALDIDWEGLQKLSQGMGSNELFIFRLDVSDKTQVYKRFQELHAKFGSLDFAINCAGIVVLGSALSHQKDDWDHLVQVNLLGTIHCSLAAFSYMAQQRSGHIVNVSSLAGLLPIDELSGYCASKFGVVGFTEQFAREAKAFQVRVSLLCPGLVDTPLLTGGRHGAIRNSRWNSKNAKKLSPKALVDRALPKIAQGKSPIILPEFQGWAVRLLRVLPSSVRNAVLNRIRPTTSATQEVFLDSTNVNEQLSASPEIETIKGSS